MRTKYSAGVSVEAEKPCREGLEKLAAEADVVFYSKTWAEVGVLTPSCEESVRVIESRPMDIRVPRTFCAVMWVQQQMRTCSSGSTLIVIYY